MIRKLVDIKSNPIQITENPITKTESPNIQNYVNAFINGMGEIQRMRFKRMLENGIKCGMSVADSYNIDYDTFINEVKKQLEVD